MELLSFGNTGWGDELFIATLMTVAVSLTAMLIGFFFALIFTPLKLSNNKFLNFIANTYTTVIRGIPELLVIYLFFFGGSGAIMYVASIFGYFEYIEINAFITGSFAIGIISGAYSTEVFRGAIQSIDKGQFEAVKALGIKKNIQFFKIIMPQMLRLAIPNLSNVWQITLKRHFINICNRVGGNNETVLYCSRINKRPFIILFCCCINLLNAYFFKYEIY